MIKTAQGNNQPQTIILQMNRETVQTWIVETEQEKERMQKEGII
jgi:uncharacterized UBP type Zn finger protein